MLPRRSTSAPEHPHVPSPVTVAQLADELVTLAAITTWVRAQPVSRALVTPAAPCLVATALTEQLRDAGWEVHVRTSYCTASVRDAHGWLLAQPWFPGDVHTLIPLIDTAAHQEPTGTLSRDACLVVLGQLGLHNGGSLPS